VWEDSSQHHGRYSSQHHGWYNNTQANNANAESPFFVPFARRHREAWHDLEIAPEDSSSIVEDAPARIWEVKPAPRGGQVGTYHTSILYLEANESLG
jgi:hypothetical protein